MVDRCSPHADLATGVMRENPDATFGGAARRHRGGGRE
jgi:hypothetical protein